MRYSVTARRLIVWKDAFKMKHLANKNKETPLRLAQFTLMLCDKLTVNSIWVVAGTVN